MLDRITRKAPTEGTDDKIDPTRPGLTTEAFSVESRSRGLNRRKRNREPLGTTLALA